MTGRAEPHTPSHARLLFQTFIFQGLLDSTPLLFSSNNLPTHSPRCMYSKQECGVHLKNEFSALKSNIQGYCLHLGTQFYRILMYKILDFYRIEAEYNYHDIKNNTPWFLFVATSSNQSFLLNILISFHLCHTLSD